MKIKWAQSSKNPQMWHKNSLVSFFIWIIKLLKIIKLLSWGSTYLYVSVRLFSEVEALILHKIQPMANQEVSDALPLASSLSHKPILANRLKQNQKGSDLEFIRTSAVLFSVPVDEKTHEGLQSQNNSRKVLSALCLVQAEPRLMSKGLDWKHE